MSRLAIGAFVGATAALVFLGLLIGGGVTCGDAAGTHAADDSNRVDSTQSDTDRQPAERQPRAAAPVGPGAVGEIPDSAVRSDTASDVVLRAVIGSSAALDVQCRVGGVDVGVLGPDGTVSLSRDDLVRASGRDVELRTRGGAASGSVRADELRLGDVRAVPLTPSDTVILVRVQGVVRCASTGRPLLGAHVSAQGAATVTAARTDAEGRFSYDALIDVEDSTPVTLELYRTGYIAARETVAAALDEASSLSFELVPDTMTASLRVDLVGENISPPAVVQVLEVPSTSVRPGFDPVEASRFASIRWVEMPSAGAWRRQRTSGRVVIFEALRPGPTTVRVRSSGLWGSGRVETVAGEQAHLSLELKRTLHVRVRVVHDCGDGCSAQQSDSSVKVRLTYADEEPEWTTRPITGSEFVLDDLPHNVKHIDLTLAGHIPARLTWVTDLASPEATVVLRRAKSFDVRLTDASGVVCVDGNTTLRYDDDEFSARIAIVGGVGARTDLAWPTHNPRVSLWDDAASTWVPAALEFRDNAILVQRL